MVKQDLIIMDGFVGMMGDGPAAGSPANARLLIGGFDPVAVDAVATTLMGFTPSKIPMIHWAEQAGVGSREYEVLGEAVDSFNLTFDKPTIAKNRIKSALFELGGRFLFRQMQKASRMVVDLETCTLCGRCKTACPFHAITIEDREVRIDASRCEFCLCCTEVCKAEAIRLEGLLIRKDAFLRS
jgi:ferredoxin